MKDTIQTVYAISDYEMPEKLKHQVFTHPFTIGQIKDRGLKYKVFAKDIYGSPVVYKYAKYNGKSSDWVLVQYGEMLLEDKANIKWEKNDVYSYVEVSGIPLLMPIADEYHCFYEEKSESKSIFLLNLFMLCALHLAFIPMLVISVFLLAIEGHYDVMCLFLVSLFFSYPYLKLLYISRR